MKGYRQCKLNTGKDLDGHNEPNAKALAC
jgi:hypothetical protein